MINNIIERIRKYVWHYYYRNRSNKNNMDYAYYSAFSDLSKKTIEKIWDKVISKLELQTDDYLLDIGCCTGEFIHYVKERIHCATGIDLETGYIRKANELFEDQPLFNFYVGDVSSAFSVPNITSINKIIINSVLHYCPEHYLFDLLSEFKKKSPSNSIFYIGDLVKSSDNKKYKGLRAISHRHAYTCHNPEDISEKCNFLNLDYKISLREGDDFLNNNRYDLYIYK